MLVCSTQSLAFIAVPKTGTTAIEMALRPKADIIFGRQRKHITAQRFHNRIAPFLEREMKIRPERFAVIREPEEQIRSWYRYRARNSKSGLETSTEDMSFDQFVRDVIADDPPVHAGIGSQWNMLTGHGEVLVHHLFAYEQPSVLHGFLNDRFGEPIVLKQKNVSPYAKAPLEPATRALLRAARAKEFALYDRVLDAGGQLQTTIA